MRKLKKLLSAVLAVLAGSDTTSSALTHILYFLTNNPTIYKRLQAEIDGLGHKLTDCTAQAQLPYLNAVMYVLLGIKSPNIYRILLCSNEGLRLLPSVLSGVQRTALKGGGGRMIGAV